MRGSWRPASLLGLWLGGQRRCFQIVRFRWDKEKHALLGGIVPKKQENIFFLIGTKNVPSVGIAQMAQKGACT